MLETSKDHSKFLEEYAVFLLISTTKNNNCIWSSCGIVARKGRGNALAPAATVLPLWQGWAVGYSQSSTQEMGISGLGHI